MEKDTEQWKSSKARYQL